jgi:RluA family pseudouridine synthase
MAELYSLHRLKVTAPDEPLFAALAKAISGLSRHQARMAVTAGLVKVAGETVHEPKLVLGAGETRLECDLRHGVKAAFKARVHEVMPPTEKPFTILYEDHELVVVDKMPGVISAPTHKPGQDKPDRGHVPELLRRVFHRQGRDVGFIGVVHRLDKDTSGCLCFALTREAQRLIAAQFSSHAASRTYRCFVARGPRRDQDTISGNLGRGSDGRRAMVEDEEPGKESITRFRVLRRFNRDHRDLGAELEVELETGRTHQIRVSLDAIGCPVYGDRVYGQRLRLDRNAAMPRPPRLMLHAHKLALDHPITGKRLEVVAPLPAAFAEFAKQLG